MSVQVLVDELLALHELMENYMFARQSIANIKTIKEYAHESGVVLSDEKLQNFEDATKHHQECLDRLLEFCAIPKHVVNVNGAAMLLQYANDRFGGEE